MRAGLTAPLALVALLTACGTPQEQCIRAATREIATVEKLIADTEADLARGYGYRWREVTRWEWEPCGDWMAGSPRRMCFEPETRQVREPVAIDPVAEQRKLSALQARLATLSRAAGPAIASCRARFPE